MKRLTHMLRRAATASPHEWQCRSQQLLFSSRNWISSRQGRSALSPRGHLRALRLRRSDIPSWWRSRQHPWFMDVQRDIALQNTSATDGSGLPWILSQADQLIDNKMPIFSHPPVEFTGQDRWHRDFILNKTAPRKFHGLVPYLDVESVGDSKYVWEPNRFAWALWLGLAYRITADRKYAEKFAELTESWFAENPYPVGINYCSALEVGLRNYAWVWALDLFSDYLSVRPDLLEQLLQGIWIGCRHVQSNLSHYFAPNTHITGEAFSLYACGAAFPEFTNSPRWRSLGRAILADESRKQFYEDGTHRELSTGYHIYSADFYLQATLISVQTGYQVPEAVTATARHLGARLADLAPHNLILPQVNDCDGGRLTCLVPQAMDGGPTLIATQMLNPDLQLVPNGTSVRGYPLLMNPREKELPRRSRPAAKTHLPVDKNASALFDSGLIAYRNTDHDYLLFRATEFGYADQPHSHDAPLGIVLHMAGRPIFVDNGVGSYTQDADTRNGFRSAAGKNTILVNGRGPSVPDGWFSWRQTTDCELISLKRFPDGFRARGKHSGFSRPGCHMFVYREVVLLDAGIVAVVDRWDADEALPLESTYTLHRDLRVDQGKQSITSSDGDVIHFLTVELSSTPGQSVQPACKPIPYSENYGDTTETTGLTFHLGSRCRGGMATIVSRVGKIEWDYDNLLRFAHADEIRLQITDSGVEPVRTDLGQSASNFADSPFA